MLKILLKKWEENKDKLQETFIAKRQLLAECQYKDIVAITFDVIFNSGGDASYNDLDISQITEIDNGDYQGTLLYCIPFKTYQPCEYEYLMTYVSYGSCSGCDTLIRIQEDMTYYDDDLAWVKDFMMLAKDILQNTIKPYNSGWRDDERFATIEIGENE